MVAEKENTSREEEKKKPARGGNENLLNRYFRVFPCRQRVPGDIEYPTANRLVSLMVTRECGPC